MNRFGRQNQRRSCSCNNPPVKVQCNEITLFDQYITMQGSLIVKAPVIDRKRLYTCRIPGRAAQTLPYWDEP